MYLRETMLWMDFYFLQQTIQDEGCRFQPLPKSIPNAHLLTLEMEHTYII